MPGNESKLFVLMEIFYHIPIQITTDFFNFSEKRRKNFAYLVKNA